MEEEEYVSELSNDFKLEIHGLEYAKDELERLKKKWVLVFKGKIRKDFYDKLLPKLYSLESKFNKELQKTLSIIRTSKRLRKESKK